MKKVIRSCILVSMCLAFAGCNGKSDTTETTTETKTEAEETAVVEMTDEEVEFLCNKYVDEQRIREGKLYDYQEEALRQYRFAKKYLESKYPGVKFTYFHLEAIAETSNEVGRLEFYAGDDEEQCYSVQITAAGADYSAEDDYGNDRFGEIYSEKVWENLSHDISCDFVVYTEVKGFFDETANVQATGEEVFTFENQKNVSIYIDMEADESKCEEMVAEIEQYFRKNEQKVSCSIGFAQDITKNCSTVVECRTFISSLEEGMYYKASFNTF